MKKIGWMVVLLMAVSAGSIIQAAAQTGSDPDAMPVVQNNNFRVQVRTNRNVYFYRDVLRFSVEVLNDSDQVLHITRADLLEPADANPDSGQVFAAQVEDQPTEVVVKPEVMPIIVGWATLTPLYGPVITDATDEASTGTADPSICPPRKIRLPLFGPTTIQPHSTRILSNASLLIGWPIDIEPQPGPVDGDPAGHADDGTADPDRPQPEPVQARICPPRPGWYLLECNIDAIWGVKLARTQKIIRVVGPRNDDARTLLKRHHQMLQEVNKRTQAIETTSRNTFSWVRINNRYLQLILRYLIGYRPIRPVTDTGTGSGDGQNGTDDGQANATPKTTTRTRTQLRTRTSY